MQITYVPLCAFLDEDTDLGCSVEDVMVFFSGTNHILPTGFAKSPTVMFTHDPQRRLATASTCDLQLRLPVCHGTDYERFKHDIILSVKGNDGFGGP